MDGEQKFWAIVVSVICMTILAIVFCSVYISTSLDKKYIDAGYTRKISPCTYMSHWVKD